MSIIYRNCIYIQNKGYEVLKFSKVLDGFMFYAPEHEGQRFILF